MQRKQIQSLKAKAHKLKPTITIGKGGLTDSLLKELDLTLEHHELIKIKVLEQDREIRLPLMQKAASLSGAELIQTLGSIAVLYRKRKDKNA